MFERRCGRVETAYLVRLFVMEDAVGARFVGVAAHLIFLDG